MAKFASLDSLRAIRDWAKEKFQSKLPEVTAQDNGDVLSVVDGEWAKSTPEKELPEVTSADNGKVLAVVAGEWEKAEAPDGLPPVQSADNGKVLTVVEGEWAKADVPDELPAVSASDNGKVLGVVEGQWAKTEPEDGLPEVTSSDNGKVLSVVEGAWAPAVPSGGSGLPEVTSEDNGDLLSVVDGAWAKSEPGYRPAMVDGTVIIPEQTMEPYEEEGQYYASYELTGIDNPIGYNTVCDWFFDDAVPETLPVTFNGVKYDVPTNAIVTDGTYTKHFWCGEVESDSPVFTNYPFCIKFRLRNRDDVLAWFEPFVPTADSFTIKIAEEVHTAIPTEDFKLAVNNSYMETTVTQETFWAAQSITTEAVSGTSYAAADGPAFDYSSPVPGKLNVVFDGTAYELPKIPMLIAYGEVTYEGSPDFTTYPLLLQVADYGSYANLQLCTPQAGTYTLEATYDVSTTAPTEKFKEAVHGVVWTGAAFQIPVVEQLNASSTTFTCRVTDDEIFAAIAHGQPLLFTFDYHGGNDSGVCPAYVLAFDAESGSGYFSIGGDFTRLSNNSIVSITFSIYKDEYHQCTYTEASLS